MNNAFGGGNWTNWMHGINKVAPNKIGSQQLIDKDFDDSLCLSIVIACTIRS